MKTRPCLHRSSRVVYTFPVYIINEVSVKIIFVPTDCADIIIKRHAFCLPFFFFLLRTIIIVLVARKTLFDNIVQTTYKGTPYGVEFSTVLFLFCYKRFLKH